MEPRIVGVDKTKALGYAVATYGDDRYWQGFVDGFVLGSTFTLLTCLVCFANITALKRS